VCDFHVHLVTRDVHPDRLSWWHPFKRAQSMVYLSAADVELGPRTEAEYVERIVDLAKGFPHPARLFVLAMDRTYREDGTVDPDRTDFHVPNEWAFEVARRHPELFVPVISVHPYRPDAIRELERWADEGCRFVKWIPNAMRIDPADVRIEPFYRSMERLGLTLLTHTGLELAVDAGDAQGFGNPLLLRKPLDLGVRVVAFHSASLGEFEDLDDPDRKEVSGFDLLVRMLENPAYDGLLFGEISAMTFYNHLDEPLRKLLARPELHDRFVHGSDYPLVGINFLLRTSSLVDGGFITEEERGFLNEIYRYNPLLFDLVVKRTVRHPETGARLPASVFRGPQALAP
jgi:mannonate dehydratase